MNTTFTDDQFREALKLWVENCQKLITNDHTINYPNLEIPKLEVQHGRRYIKIWETTSSSFSKRIYAFIDGLNGDVLLPASYKAPAKHPRGNIMDDKGGMGMMGPYGPAYLR